MIPTESDVYQSPEAQARLTEPWHTAQAAIAQLTERQHDDGGWPYTADQSDSFTEPTSWALVALRAAGALTPEIAASGAGYLKRGQFHSGAFSSGAHFGEANWATSPAVLALSTVGEVEAARRGAAWLLGFHGMHWQRRPGEYAEHDTALEGWPWLAGTHSWVEPTCCTVFALRSVGVNPEPRINEAVRMVRDRALPSGGWNYGNTRVLQQELRSFPSTTGMALVVLAGETDSPQVRGGLRNLSDELAGIRTPWALGWSLLAGTVHGLEHLGLSDPAAVRQKIDDCLERQLARPQRLRLHELAVLLLAATPSGAELLLKSQSPDQAP